MKLLRTVAGPAIALAVLLVWIRFFWTKEGQSSGTHPTPRSNEHSTTGEPRLQPLGAASCVATACHGNPAAQLPPSFTGELAIDRPCDSWNSSYFAWASHDKHARAFDILKYDPDKVERDPSGVIINRSQRIIANLRHHDKSWKNAWEDSRCLACHSNPTLASAKPDNHEALSLQKEGVSCEACHGDSSKWRTQHTSWDAKTDRNHEYTATGMTKLYDIGVRAHTCAGCHIGAPADPEKGIPLRDVNHDLIAAGHPRLNFEFATYSRMMPPHWREKDRVPTEEKAEFADKECKKGFLRKPGFEADFWAIGQAVQAEATLKLLEARTKELTLPEFAEFNCYACHHDLQPTRWRGQRPGNSPFGSIVWNRPTVFTENSAKGLLLDAFQKTKAVEDKLSPKMEKPDSATIDAAIAAWKKWRTEGIPGTPAQTLGLLPLDEKDMPALDWDQAARIYAAAIAIENAQRDQRRRENKPIDKPQVERALKDLYDFLFLARDPPKFDSPKNYLQSKAIYLIKEWMDWAKKE